MTQSEFFKRLGAPLNNSRWSWGAYRTDGSLVLRIWKDRVREFDGRPFAMLTHHSRYAHNQGKPGYKALNLTIKLSEPGPGGMLNHSIQPLDRMGRQNLQHLQRLDQALSPRLSDQAVDRRIACLNFGDPLSEQPMDLRRHDNARQELAVLRASVTTTHHHLSFRWRAQYRWAGRPGRLVDFSSLTGHHSLPMYSTEYIDAGATGVGGRRNV